MLASSAIAASLLVTFGAHAQEAEPQPPPAAAPSAAPSPAPPPPPPPTGAAPAPAPAPAAPARVPAIEVRPGTEPAPDTDGGKGAAEIVAGPPQLLPGWNQRRVPVVLVGARPEVSLRIRPLGDPKSEKDCGQSCVASVRPGNYEVSVFEKGQDTGSRKFVLTYPERLTFTPPDQKAARTGLIVGIAGSVVFEAGVILTVIAYFPSLSECADSDCSEAAGWVGPVGLGSLLAGAVAAPIGWVMFANNSDPAVERTTVDPVTLKPSAKPATSPRVTARVQPLPDGVFVGGSARF